MSADKVVAPPESGIVTFLHCAQCVDERPEGVSPREYIKVECGLSNSLFVVWCVRHEQIVLAFTPIELAGFIQQLNEGEITCGKCGESLVDHHEH